MEKNVSLCFVISILVNLLFVFNTNPIQNDEYHLSINENKEFMVNEDLNKIGDEIILSCGSYSCINTELKKAQETTEDEEAEFISVKRTDNIKYDILKNKDDCVVDPAKTMCDISHKPEISESSELEQDQIGISETCSKTEQNEAKEDKNFETDTNAPFNFYEVKNQDFDETELIEIDKSLMVVNNESKQIETDEMPLVNENEENESTLSDKDTIIGIEQNKNDDEVIQGNKMEEIDEQEDPEGNEVKAKDINELDTIKKNSDHQVETIVDFEKSTLQEANYKKNDAFNVYLSRLSSLIDILKDFDLNLSKIFDQEIEMLINNIKRFLEYLYENNLAVFENILKILEIRTEKKQERVEEIAQYIKNIFDKKNHKCLADKEGKIKEHIISILKNNKIILIHCQNVLKTSNKQESLYFLPIALSFTNKNENNDRSEDTFNIFSILNEILGFIRSDIKVAQFFTFEVENLVPSYIANELQFQILKDKMCEILYVLISSTSKILKIFKNDENIILINQGIMTSNEQCFKNMHTREKTISQIINEYKWTYMITGFIVGFCTGALMVYAIFNPK